MVWLSQREEGAGGRRQREGHLLKGAWVWFELYDVALKGRPKNFTVTFSSAVKKTKDLLGLLRNSKYWEGTTMSISVHFFL